MTTQAEEVAITEEDLELIKERETNIRQLEVRLSFIFLMVTEIVTIKTRIRNDMTERAPESSLIMEG